MSIKIKAKCDVRVECPISIKIKAECDVRVESSTCDSMYQLDDVSMLHWARWVVNYQALSVEGTSDELLHVMESGKHHEITGNYC